MNYPSTVFSLWTWTPTLGIALAFFLGWGFRLGRKAPQIRHWVYFALAVLLTVVALASPLAALAENYLFSAHMLQHLLLLMIIPPLLWVSIPQRNALPPLWLRRFQSPLLGWLVGVSLMWGLHLPLLINGAFGSSGNAILCGTAIAGESPAGAWLHPFYLGLTLVAGLWFALPILSPWKQNRLPPLQGILFLVTACIVCSVLGILITFAPTEAYPGLLAPDTVGIQYLIRHKWGLMPSTDQQFAGLLMWVLGCFIYLSASLYLLNQWFSAKEDPTDVSAIHLINTTHYDQ